MEDLHNVLFGRSCDRLSPVNRRNLDSRVAQDLLDLIGQSYGTEPHGIALYEVLAELATASVLVTIRRYEHQNICSSALHVERLTRGIGFLCVDSLLIRNFG